MDSPSPWLINMLALAVEKAVYPWKEPKELRAKTVQQVHDFIRTHKSVMA
jgi:hypothetical protein